MKTPTPISISRYLAFVLGTLTPLAETIRRWSTWQNDPPSFFDDFFIGGFLLLGALLVSKNPWRGQRYLTAAFGFMCGMVYPSFFGQLEAIRMGEVDPAPISTTSVAIVKGVGFALAIAGLLLSLKKLPEERSIRAS